MFNMHFFWGNSFLKNLIFFLITDELLMQKQCAKTQMIKAD